MPDNLPVKRANATGSATAARKFFVEGADPLEFLLPWERIAAEVYVRIGGLPEMTNRDGDPYADAFHTQLFVDIPSLPKRAYLRRLQANPAWRAYVGDLQHHARTHAMSKLQATAQRAVDNYLWAQESARSAGDYKETRMASGDHLDRVGATEKPPDHVVQVATITLRSRNFDETDLLKAGPELLQEADDERS